MSWSAQFAVPVSTFPAERGCGRWLAAVLWLAFCAVAFAQGGPAPVPRAAATAPAPSSTAPAPSSTVKGPAQWLPIAKDGLRDPASPAVRLLQNPAEALAPLPRDSSGNLVNWVKALEDGAIAPRASLRPQTEVRVLDSEIMLNLKGGTPMVRFPHRAHTQWLDCSNCHEQLFRSRAGANRLSMFRMLEGEQCGVCHGAVAFPLTECSRCHNTPRPAAARR